MGDIGNGIGQIHLILLEILLLFPQTDDHFADFTLQNGQLALFVPVQINAVLPMKHPVQVSRQGCNPLVAAASTQQVQHGKQYTQHRREPAEGRIPHKRRYGSQERQEQMECQKPKDFQIAQQIHDSSTLYPKPRTVLIYFGFWGASSSFSRSRLI